MTGPQPGQLLAQISRAAARYHLFVSGTLEVPLQELALPGPVHPPALQADPPAGRSGQTLGVDGGNPPAAAALSRAEPGAATPGSGAGSGPHAGEDSGATAWLALLSADEPGFWPHVTGAPEFRDGAVNPLDRWSLRVVTSLAQELGAQALFPFGGPPWHPFLRWAEGSGRSFPSPVVLHVHDRMGLWASWRGALVLRTPLPATAQANPCLSCAAQPCRTACPAGAMRPGAYDIQACHDWLDRPEGANCLTRGCLVRRACRVSRLYGRLEAESAHHMRHFHP